MPQSPRPDPSYDVFTSSRAGLDAIFAPQRVAVIGATERPGAVGRTILWNLISNPFGGTVYPVNPTRDSVLGIKAYPSLRHVPATTLQPDTLTLVPSRLSTVSRTSQFSPVSRQCGNFSRL